jgi:hypothetical protein
MNDNGNISKKFRKKMPYLHVYIYVIIMLSDKDR